jgi:hypothetical protein
MSRPMDHADKLAAYLMQVLPWCKTFHPDEPPVPVIVDRKAELNSIIAQTVGKARGASIVILSTGGRNPDRKSKTLNMGGTFSVFVMTKPLFMDGSVTCYDLTEAVMEAMHGWSPKGGKSPVTQRMEVLEYELTPLKNLVIYQITAEITRLKL